MKFLFFSGGAYFGGMEMVTMHLMAALRDDNHDVRAVVSGWNDGVYPRMLDSRGIPNSQIKLGRLYLRKPTWTLDGIINYPKAVWKLRRLLDDMKPDVIFLPSNHLAFMALPAIPKKYPVIFYLHEVPSEIFISVMGRYVFSRICGVIVVSEFAGSLLRGMMPKTSIQVVHNGFPEMSYPTGFSRLDSHDRLKVGVVGQVTPIKRHEYLVRVAASLHKKQISDISFVIYGEADTVYAVTVRKEIARLRLENYFEWEGFRERQEEIYGNVDVVVSASLFEAFGATIIEAGAWQLPVVASRSGGFCETIIDGVTGFLVDPDDSNEMASRLIALRDGVLREKLGQAAMHHVSTNFSINIMRDNFVSACNHLISR